MPTQRGGYYTRDGIKRPSVTTIVGRFKDSGALIQWAYRKGREHQGAADRGLPAPAHLHDEVEAAAAVGTIVHAMAEHRVHKRDPWKETEAARHPLSAEDAQKVANGYQAFDNWLTMTRLEIVYTEVAMVSEALLCGGTLDWIGRLDGKLVLGDFKTSSAIYTDHLIQVAAYREMWNETHPTEPLAEGAHILQFGKAAGDFHHAYFPELTDALELFKLYRIAYTRDLKLKERAR